MATATAPMRSGSIPAHAPSATDLERLATYPYVVISWIDDAGYPTSVATSFEADPAAGTVRIGSPAGMPIPTDREISLTGSHIRPQPGIGYDERRYLQLWGRSDGTTFTPSRAWGWDETEVPFFEYSERSVPQSRRYLAALSVEKGRTIRPRLSPFWLALRTTRLRSVDGSVDVSRIAREMGGGGHARAAGFSTDLEYPQLVEFLRARCPWDAQQTPASLRRAAVSDTRATISPTSVSRSPFIPTDTAPGRFNFIFRPSALFPIRS